MLNTAVTKHLREGEAYPDHETPVCEPKKTIRDQKPFYAESSQKKKGRDSREKKGGEGTRRGSAHPGDVMHARRVEFEELSSSESAERAGKDVETG